MKRKYQQPSIQVLTLTSSTSFLANSFNGSSLNIYSPAIADGNGSDAVKTGGDWSDIWD